jgi:hypothetical protein
MPIVQSYCVEEAVPKGNTLGQYQAAVASNRRNLRNVPRLDPLPLTYPSVLSVGTLTSSRAAAVLPLFKVAQPILAVPSQAVLQITKRVAVSELQLIAARKPKFR